MILAKFIQAIPHFIQQIAKAKTIVIVFSNENNEYEEEYVIEDE